MTEGEEEPEAETPEDTVPMTVFEVNAVSSRLLCDRRRLYVHLTDLLNLFSRQLMNIWIARGIDGDNLGKGWLADSSSVIDLKENQGSVIDFPHLPD